MWEWEQFRLESVSVYTLVAKRRERGLDFIQSRLVYKATTIKWGFLKNDYSLLFLFRFYSPCKINLVYYNNKSLKTPSPQS